MTELEAYNEAKNFISIYHNYKGDKRNIAYKNMQRRVIDVYIHRMNNFAKKLGLPNYYEVFFN